MYSFHNDIGLELNDIADRILNIRLERFCVFDRDQTELGSFCESMIMLLYIKNYYMPDNKISNFVLECKPYIRVNGNEINETEAKRLFVLFKKIEAELPRTIE